MMRVVNKRVVLLLRSAFYSAWLKLVHPSQINASILVSGSCVRLATLRLRSAFVGKELNRSYSSLGVHASWLSFFTILQMLSNPTAEARGAADETNVIAEISTLLIEADDLFNQNKFSDTYELLQHLHDCTNVEVLWRIIRALYNMSKIDKSAKRKEYIRNGFRISERALELDSNNANVHKWYAIMLDGNAELDGIKARVTLSPTFKDHMLKAVELNPKDATAYYCLGSWCFSYADLPWYQRKIASAVFASPPTSTFEEALEYFIKAEESDPNFYSVNLLMLGKTYLRLKMIDQAKHYLTLTAMRQAQTDEDMQASKEAEELLKQIKV